MPNLHERARKIVAQGSPFSFSASSRSRSSCLARIFSSRSAQRRASRSSRALSCAARRSSFWASRCCLASSAATRLCCPCNSRSSTFVGRPRKSCARFSAFSARRRSFSSRTAFRRSTPSWTRCSRLPGAPPQDPLRPARPFEPALPARPSRTEAGPGVRAASAIRNTRQPRSYRPGPEGHQDEDCAVHSWFPTSVGDPYDPPRLTQ